MLGRKVFMDSLVAHGVTHIFGNPGTTESPLLDSLAAYPSIRYVTALQESIALCAASYYAQASGGTGIVSLHVAPGLGNAMGMLYGALRAGSPMIVTAGQQDTRMRLNNPVLGHDLVAMAQPLTKWAVQVERADEMGPIMRRAFKIAHDGPPGPVFVGLPINVMEQETSISAFTPMLRQTLSAAASVDALRPVSELILAARKPVIVCGDAAARSGASDSLVRLAEAIGASVWFEGLRMHNPFPTAHPSARLGLPLDAGSIAKVLADSDLVLLVGGAFFEDVWWSADGPFPAGAKVVQIEAGPEPLAHSVAIDVGVTGDIPQTIAALAAGIEAQSGDSYRQAAGHRNADLRATKDKEIAAQKARAEKAWGRSPIAMPRVMAEIKAALPANAIIIDETITASIDLARSIDFAHTGDYYGSRGGGIGQGLAGALGVAVAEPDRPVVCLSGDGSAMYAIQALWTAAHTGLPIVFIILANREYRVLKHNVDVYRQRFNISSQEPYAEMDLTGPQLGFVEMARGMGVDGVRITDAGDIGAALNAAFASGQAHLIEIEIEAKR